MRVVLTGATGFLGTHVRAQLAGHEVLCLSRDPDRVPRAAGLRAVRADLKSDGEWIAEVAAFRPEWCFHLAWEGLPDYSLRQCRLNLDASLRLLEALARSGVRRVIGAGSCWEYGVASGPVGEDTVPRAPGAFAATKQALLTMLDAVARESAFEYRWARIFFVYGTGQRRESLIPHLGAAYASGQTPNIREPQTVQDFIHADDVASALVALAGADAPSGVFNIGTGQPTPVGHVANLAADHFSKPRPFEGTAAGRGFWADMTKMHALTGWRARTAIDEGIRKTLVDLDHAR
jgi:nucleoside-diphosphate-sugar epimerase